MNDIGIDNTRHKETPFIIYIYAQRPEEGGVVTLSAIVAYSIADGQDRNVAFALIAALAVGGLVGLVNGLGVTYLKIAPLVMTLGMAGVVSGLILVITQGSVSGAVASIIPFLEYLVNEAVPWQHLPVIICVISAGWLSIIEIGVITVIGVIEKINSPGFCAVWHNDTIWSPEVFGVIGVIGHDQP